jgi:nicotinamidase-related amidase
MTEIRPGHTALVTLDYQVGILGMLPETETTLAAAEQAIAVVRGTGGHIAHVRVAFTESDYARMPETSAMAAGLTDELRKAMLADSPTAAIHERVAPRDGDIVLRKTRVGAFSTTDLDQRLRERAVDTLILAGVATSGAVLSTMRDAADRDYRLVILTDACADPDPQVHAVLTEKVFPRHARVISTAELPELLGARG